MRDAPQRFTVGQVATAYTTRITPNPTVPIRTGHRATTRLARNIPRAVAISNDAPCGQMAPSLLW
jgi:hypothetical protein